MMGAFPPPVGGAAKINGLVHDALLDGGTAVTKIDLASRRLAHNRSIAYHLRRLIRNTAGAISARRHGARGSLLYLVPDGGAGAWYSLAHVKLAGAVYDRIVIHHHTCRYIAHDSRPLAMLTAAHRDKAIHVFLSPGMARQFQERYGPVEHFVASNSRFVSDEALRPFPSRSGGGLRMGHLSNLCRGKGFFDVADTFEAVRRAGLHAELHVAGPVLEPEVDRRLERLSREHGSALHRYGPLAGDEKLEFYRGIDLFLFPTRWPQEAAPIVTYEAAAAGVPVLAYDRGVISEIVQGVRGSVCPTDRSFAEFALPHLVSLDLAAEPRRARGEAIKDSIRADCARSTIEYEQLIGLLSGGRALTTRIGSS